MKEEKQEQEPSSSIRPLGTKDLTRVQSVLKEDNLKHNTHFII